MVKFTDEENGFIDESFSITLLHYAKKPKDRTKLKDIRVILVYRNMYIGHIGKEGHRIIHSIFKKMGYCEDGQKTLKQQREEDLAKAQEKANEFKVKTEKAVIDIDQKIAELQNLKNELLTHKQSFGEILKEKEAEAKIKFEEEMKQEQKRSQDNIIDKINKSIDKMNLRELRLVAKEHKIPLYSRMPKEELLLAVQAAEGDGN